MADLLHPAPIREPFLDQNGFVTRIWAIWLQSLFNQVSTPTGAAGADQSILEAFDSHGATGENRVQISDLQAQLAAADTPRPVLKPADILQALFLQDAPSFAGVLGKIRDLQAQLGFSDIQATGLLLRKIQESNFSSIALEPNRDGDILRRLNELQILINTIPVGPFGNIRGNNQTTTANLVPTFSDATGKNIAPSIVGIDGSGNLTGVAAINNGATGTTQASTDNTAKLATDAFVQNVVAAAIAGVNPAVAVQAATTAAADTSGLTYNNGAAGIGATFTGLANTALTVDGYTFTALGQRLLVKNDTQAPSGAFNGVYYVTQVQTLILPIILTRALDYDTPSDINNTGAIPVVNGTVNTDTSWLLTSSVATVGTDPLTYVKFSLNPTTIVTSNNANLKLSVNTVAPAGPATNDLWVDTN